LRITNLSELSLVPRPPPSDHALDRIEAASVTLSKVSEQLVHMNAALE
jgi:hypothetical protein